MKICKVSRCWCCEGYSHETMTHLFLTAPIAKQLWEYFTNTTEIQVDGNQLHLMIKRWWTGAKTPMLQQVYRALPPLILWELWRRGNTRRHGRDTSLYIMIHNIQRSVHYMIELPNSKLRTIGHRCDQLLKDLEDYRPKLYHHKVI